jgi:hypothetical protein
MYWWQRVIEDIGIVPEPSPGMGGGKIVQLTNENTPPDIVDVSTAAPWLPKPKPPLGPIRRLLPFDAEGELTIIRDFEAGHTMHTLATHWGVDVLAIEDVIRQALRRHNDPR